MNGVPVARQSRDPARPQAGESATLHQKKIHGHRLWIFFCMWKSDENRRFDK